MLSIHKSNSSECLYKKKNGKVLVGSKPDETAYIVAYTSSYYA